MLNLVFCLEMSDSFMKSSQGHWLFFGNHEESGDKASDEHSIVPCSTVEKVILKSERIKAIAYLRWI